MLLLPLIEIQFMVLILTRAGFDGQALDSASDGR
jgi:hypothetical protein